jgi:hypothetical protein
MAARLRGLYSTVAGVPRTLRLKRVYWYTWASEYRGARGDIFRFTGLFRWAGKGQPVAQPAYRAYVRTARTLEGR